MTVQDIPGKDELSAALRDAARMICAEQPDVPEPESVRELDSFSFVQVILEIENYYDVLLLENLDDFHGETFDDLADFVARQAGADVEPVAP